MTKEKQEIKLSIINNDYGDDYQTPIFKRSRSREWIPYGEDNLYPNKLQKLMNNSALNNAIISSKLDNIVGKGLIFKENNICAEKMFLSPNPYETLNELFTKVVFDNILYGGYALNIIWAKNKKTIAEIHHIDFSKIRMGSENQLGQIEDYWYSKDWSAYRKSENTPVKMNKFDINNRQGSQLLYVKDYRPGCEYYPLPSYIGAVKYIEVDIEIANFHLSNTKNGMMPNGIISFHNGTPTKEKQKEIERSIKSKFSGTSNAGKFLLTFSDTKDDAPTYEAITPSQLDKQFQILEESVLQNILSGHKIVSPMLVGIKTEGQLGGSSELINSYSIYKKTIIEPYQEQLLSVFNRLVKINKLPELEIIQADPLSELKNQTE